MGNTGKADLLLHIVHRWHVCAFDEKNRDLPVVIYCSAMMYKYSYHIGFISNKHNKEGNYTNKVVLNHIIHFIPNHPRVNYIHGGFYVQL